MKGGRTGERVIIMAHCVGHFTDIQIRPVIYIGNRTDIDSVPERNRNASKDFFSRLLGKMTLVWRKMAGRFPCLIFAAQIPKRVIG